MKMNQETNKNQGLIRTIKMYQLIILALIIFIIGIYFNFYVMINNGGKMPVKLYDSPYDYESSKHFSFNNNEEVKFWILSDMIPIGYSRLSIGGIYIFCGIIIMVYVNLLNLKFFINKRKCTQDKSS